MIIVVECRNTKSADYWWRYTIDMLYKDDPSMIDSIDFMYKKIPRRMIHMSQFDLYFISESDMYNFMKGRHRDDIKGMQDYQYESMIDTFLKRRRDSNLYNEL